MASMREKNEKKYILQDGCLLVEETVTEVKIKKIIVRFLEIFFFLANPFSLKIKIFCDRFYTMKNFFIFKKSVVFKIKI